jgi:hypothetical protein
MLLVAPHGDVRSVVAERLLQSLQRGGDVAVVDDDDRVARAACRVRRRRLLARLTSFRLRSAMLFTMSGGIAI